jgi:hypothetical protein
MLSGKRKCRIGLLAGAILAVMLAGLAVPALAQGPWPMPEVLLEVHPNERAPGAASNWYLGGAPWTQPSTTPAATYWWQHYEFAAGDPFQAPGGGVALWVQVCVQNWGSTQKGYAGNDRTKLQVNGVVPTDYDLVQSGTPGSWQWLGKTDLGKRITLRFLVLGTQGKQTLSLGAAESPVAWWIKVTDLQEHLVYPID